MNMVDNQIWTRLDEFASEYKKLEEENKFDEAIQVVEKEKLYLQARIEAGLNIADDAILKSVFRDLVLVIRSIKTNKKLFELEQRVDNISHQVGKLTKDFDGRIDLK